MHSYSSYKNPIQIHKYHEIHELFEAKTRQNILLIQLILTIVGVVLLLWALVPTVHFAQLSSTYPSEFTEASVTIDRHDSTSAPKIVYKTSALRIFIYLQEWQAWLANTIYIPQSPINSQAPTAACVLG